ncbi:MAG: response regulator [Synergistaceae bacterium]|nr:response regulator [Synergistaceae bacterium]
MFDEIPTPEEYRQLKEETERLRGENAKLARRLRTMLELAERVQSTTVGSMALSAVLSAERSHREIFLDLILENSPDIILLFDQEDRFLYSTDTFLKSAQIRNFGLIGGRKFFEVFSSLMEAGEARRLADIFVKSKKERTSAYLEWTIDFSRRGNPHTYTIHFTPMLDGKGRITGSMALFHDLTDVLQARQSEAASQAKSAFLATISHEIRTPLNAIIGLSEMELRNTLPKKTHENLEKIYNSGSNLLSIVNDILDISKIESGSFELLPARYDIAAMINDTVQLNMVRIGSKNITFELFLNETLPSFFCGDELRIKQILNNLLSNAIKYTDAGKVTFRIDWEYRSKTAWLIFEVTDTGHGIRREDMGRLFSRYTQITTQANRHIEGTGLGLSITKNLVDIMGGTISVESEYQKGSSFKVEIPQVVSDETPIGEETVKKLKEFHFIETRRSRSKNLIRTYMPWGKVLIVDDVPINLDVAKGLMLPYGLTIDCAESGEEALEKIRQEKPKYDIVFMDHMMPGMDGIEATRIIREMETDYAKNLPVVALTANALAGNREMFLANGFNGFISKPIDIMQLDAVLRQWIPKPDRTALQLMEHTEKDRENAKPLLPRQELLKGKILEGVDLVAGIECCNGEEAYLDVLRSYATHTPDLLEQMLQVSRENLEDYVITVHGLKGASYGIRADATGRRAESLEQAARAGHFEMVRAGNVSFVATVKDLLSRLEELLAGISSESTRGRERVAGPDSALLTELLEACKHYKSLLMEEILTELERYEYETGNELIQWLREQLNALEYETIRERLENLLAEKKN